MIRGLDKFGVENSPTFDILFYLEHFSQVVDQVIVKRSMTVTTDWTTIDWNSITGEPLSSFIPDTDSTWYLFEVENKLVSGAGLTLNSTSSNAVTPINVVLSDTVGGEVYHYSDYFLPFEDKTLTSISIDNPTGVYWAIRTAEANTEDWTDFPNTWDAAAILAAINAGGVKGLHLWFYGTRTLTIESPNISEIEYYNHEDNIKFSEPIDGLARTYDGVTQYDTVANVLAPTKDKEQIFNFSFNLTDYTSGTVYGLLYPKFANLHGLCYIAAIVPDASGNNNKMIFIVYDNFDTTNEPYNYWRVEDVKLKNGRNNVIIHLKDYTVVTGVDFYINGNKSSNVTLTQDLGGVPATASPIIDDYHIGQRVGTLGSSYPLYGEMKILQWLDITGQTLDANALYKIYNSGTAKSVYTNSSDYIIDFNPEGAFPTDDSPNNYTITPFGGFTQTQFMD